MKRALTERSVFSFVCEEHGVRLAGPPHFTNVTARPLIEFTIILSDMTCPGTGPRGDGKPLDWCHPRWRSWVDG